MRLETVFMEEIGMGFFKKNVNFEIERLSSLFFVIGGVVKEMVLVSGKIGVC